MSLIPAILRRNRAKPRKARAPRAAPLDAAHADGAAEQAVPLAQFRDDPAAFVAHALPNAGKPYPKQLEMLNLAAKKRKISIVGCNGSGKDWTLARIILWWLETRPQAVVVVLAPTKRQMVEILWRQLAVAVANASVPLSGKLTRDRYEISPDRFAIAFATDQPERIQGFHSPELLLIVDEAHAVKQSHLDAARRLNAAKTIMAGNALPMPGDFFDSHHSKRHLYATLRISASDTPNLQDGAEPVPGLISPEDIKDKADSWGEDHPLFRSAVYAEFPDALDDSLVGRQAVEDAMADDAPSGEGAPSESDDEKEPVYIGVDVARFGEDKSVLIARRGQRVIAVKPLGRDMDTMRVAGEAALMAADLDAQAIFVDENGVGGGVCDRLKEIGAPVYGVQFGRRAPHPTRFANLRSEIFWELRRLMKDRLIALPSDETLAAQLLSLRYDVSSSGQVKLESKRETRKRGIPSPDRADALALAFMRPPSLQIWTGYEPFLRPRPPAGVPLPTSPSAPPDDDDGGEDNGSPSPYKGRGRREAAGEGTGGAPPDDDDDDGNGAAPHDRHSGVGGNPAPNGVAERNAAYGNGADINPHSGVGRNPEGAADAPAPQNPADVPLDRHFIRF